MTTWLFFLRTQRSRASWKVLEILLENFRTGKVLQNDLGPGKSWNLLGNDADGSFWLQIDMFLQTKVAIIVVTRYVFWAARVPKTLWPGLPDSTGEFTALPQIP